MLADTRRSIASIHKSLPDPHGTDWDCSCPLFWPLTDQTPLVLNRRVLYLLCVSASHSAQ